MQLRLLAIGLVVLASNNLQAQDSLQRFVRQIDRCIELHIPASEDLFLPKDEQKTQYYIVDIHLDSAGRISRADYFGKSNLKSSIYISKAVDSIARTNLRLVASRVRRIIIPVFIVFSETHPVYDLPFFPKDMKRETADEETYITKDLLIGVFEVHDSQKQKSPAAIVMQREN